MSRLAASIRRQNKYQLGGLVTVIAWPTRMPSGLPGATITRNPVGDGPVTGIVLADDNAAYVLEFKPNEATWNGDTQFGTNIYIKPSLAIKFEGMTTELNAAKKAFDLGTHTFLCKDKNGNVILLGEHNGLEADKSAVGGGGNNDTYAGHDINLIGGEVEPVPLVPVAVLNTLLTAIAEAEG